MDPEQIFTGIGAVVTAAGGCTLILREMRRRDRVESQREIEELSRELHDLRNSFLEFRHFTFSLRSLMVDNGLNPPEAPQPRFTSKHDV